MGAPSPAKQAAMQQQAIDRQIAMQRQLQAEAEQSAQERLQQEEADRTAKAASELRSRMAVSQGRRASRFASNTRAVLNEMGVLG
jgi:hypothetical protein